MKRSAPLQRRAWLRRSGPIKTRPERKARRFEAAFHSVGFVQWVHGLGCTVDGCQRTDIECAHVVRKRSQGGTWQEIAPLCRAHHREQERIWTAAFDRIHGTRLELAASAVALRWRAYCLDSRHVRGIPD